MRGCGQSEPQTSWSGLAATSASWKRVRVRIVRRLPADAVRAGKLHPAAAVAEQAQQALEARRGRAALRVGAAHVVDHHRQADRFQRSGSCRRGPCTSIQSCRCQPSSRMTGASVLRGLERHAAAIVQLPVAEEMIEAQAAHAERMPAAQFGRRRVGIRDRDAAQPLRLALQRIEHRGIVAPVRAALHQHAAVEAERVEQLRGISRAARPAACSCGRPHRGSTRPGRTRGNACRRRSAASRRPAGSARAAEGRARMTHPRILASGPTLRVMRTLGAEPRMKRSVISTGSRSVAPTPGLSSMRTAISHGPSSAERARDHLVEHLLVRRPGALRKAGAARHGDEVGAGRGRGRLAAGDLVAAVVHHDDREVLRLEHRDGGEAADLHQQRAVALERDAAPLRLRQRDAERDRAGEPHAAEHVEILRPVAGRPEIEIGVADAADHGLVLQRRDQPLGQREAVHHLRVAGADREDGIMFMP